MNDPIMPPTAAIIENAPQNQIEAEFQATAQLFSEADQSHKESKEAEKNVRKKFLTPEYQDYLRQRAEISDYIDEEKKKMNQAIANDEEAAELIEIAAADKSKRDELAAKLRELASKMDVTNLRNIQVIGIDKKIQLQRNIQVFINGKAV